jgi:coproporphyrinogen III oxidase-like Fe-S oxidoreductase
VSAGGPYRGVAGAAGTAGPAARAPFEGPVRHVYVHVPFCRIRCDYCDFASRPLAVDAGGRAGAQVARRLDAYVEALTAEWERERGGPPRRPRPTRHVGRRGSSAFSSSSART